MKILAILLALACALPEEYEFNKVGYAKGLSHSAVLSLFQDNTDLVWMGTYDGLNCYDGTSMQTYRSDFRADGTFKAGDREEHYYTTQYAVYAGPDSDPVGMAYAYNILDLRQGQILNLRDEKTGTVYKMKPVKAD